MDTQGIKGKLWILIMGVCFLMIAFSLALAESNFPMRPIEIVIPMTPGGGNDICFRVFQERVPEFLGQPIVPSYKPGAAGATGTLFVAKSKPDGYTLLLANKSAVINTPLMRKGIGYTLDDLAPICMIATAPSFYYVKDDTPYRTLMDWVEAAKSKNMKYGTTGAFSGSYVSIAYLEKVFGFRATHIPYEGGASVAVAALSGNVDLACTSLGGAMVGPGKLRAIACSSDERFELCPEVPTLIELGFPMFKGEVISASYSLWAPKGTPKDIVDKIYLGFKKAVDKDRKEIAKTLINSDYTLAFWSPEELGKSARYTYATFNKFLVETGWTPK